MKAPAIKMCEACDGRGWRKSAPPAEAPPSSAAVVAGAVKPGERVLYFPSGSGGGYAATVLDVEASEPEQTSPAGAPAEATGAAAAEADPVRSAPAVLGTCGVFGLLHSRPHKHVPGTCSAWTPQPAPAVTLGICDNEKTPHAFDSHSETSLCFGWTRAQPAPTVTRAELAEALRELNAKTETLLRAYGDWRARMDTLRKCSYENAHAEYLAARGVLTVLLDAERAP